MKREEIVESLACGGTVFDLAVVGGGATGLGVALDAALRGFSVVLLESDDLAGGTSSRATKLLHGGVRYLAQGNVSLVREALAERTNVLHNAPHLAQPLPFVMPSYQWWHQPFYGLGLKLYDLMAGKAGLGATRFLSRQETLDSLPGLSAHGLKGGVRYWDGQFDDARLALALARSAEQAGASILNHARVDDVIPETPGSKRDADGLRQYTIRATDRRTSEAIEVKARCVVNATGVWVDHLRMHAKAGTGPGVRPMVSPSQGVHVVVDQSFLATDHALLIPRTRDGRVLFAVPWLGKLILGTTDTPRQDIPREPEPFDEELDFLLRESAGVLARPVKPGDVRSVWVGLRPLVAASDASDGATKTLSREHTIVVGEHGMVTVTGGKWTTYRAMAEDVLEQCFAAGLLPRKGACNTAHHKLFGAPASNGDPQAAQPMHAAPGLHLYGSQAGAVNQCPGSAQHLGMGLTEAMVRYAVRHEWAQTVEDVLARRWRSLFLDARQAGVMAPRVAAILSDEGIKQPDEQAFMGLCEQYLPAGQLRKAAGQGI
ncbi:glycerol-3-phosphate dehydrogenase/oxidase [Hydrogenophaga sp. 5NK40-0174]|uniref:glycerol-3-phosphate dehydrogenase/oxidase n=1 Tax=Hydrogenophaga sp. 5NK40-0174 TaxID=3127649 RepID=UPI00333FBA73